jgi:prevent-host-death family protein
MPGAENQQPDDLDADPLDVPPEGGPTPLHWDEAPPPSVPPPYVPPMFEVTTGELDRSASRVIRRVRRGEVAVITRHGLPAAVMLSIPDAVEMLPDRLMGGSDGAALSRKYIERWEERLSSARMHGRWY